MKKTVLIVEDEFLIALDLQLMLESHGWQVIGPAAYVADAMALLAEGMSDMAVLDVNLGRELVTPIAEMLCAHGVPFVIASAHAHPESFGGDVLAGVPNVGKPTSKLRLIEALKQF